MLCRRQKLRCRCVNVIYWFGILAHWSAMLLMIIYAICPAFLLALLSGDIAFLSCWRHRSSVTKLSNSLSGLLDILCGEVRLRCFCYVQWQSGPRFNIKTTSYQYRKSYCGDKTILLPSYLHNGISYTGKMSSLYWIGAQLMIGQCDQWMIGRWNRVRCKL